MFGSKAVKCSGFLILQRVKKLFTIKETLTMKQLNGGGKQTRVVNMKPEDQITSPTSLREEKTFSLCIQKRTDSVQMICRWKGGLRCSHNNSKSSIPGSHPPLRWLAYTKQPQMNFFTGKTVFFQDICLLSHLVQPAMSEYSIC